MEELDAAAQQRRETFARYGLTMYHAQCVEKSLAMLVGTVFNEKFLPSDPDDREAMQEKELKKTMGRLLKQLKKRVAISATLDQDLSDAHKKRNWLAHNYFLERSFDVMTTHGRDKMIDELTELTDFFSTLDKRLMAIFEEWLLKVGVSKKQLQEESEKLLKETEQEGCGSA